MTMDRKSPVAILVRERDREEILEAKKTHLLDSVNQFVEDQELLEAGSI